jgi:hypothetical protein
VCPHTHTCVQAAAHVDPTARQSVDSVDELVARNIREVLSAVQLDDVGTCNLCFLPAIAHWLFCQRVHYNAVQA